MYKWIIGYFDVGSTENKPEYNPYRDLVGIYIRHGFLKEILTKLLSIPRQ